MALIIWPAISSSAPAHSDSVAVTQWLSIHPVTFPSPAYHDVERLGGKTWSASDLLQADLSDYGQWLPESGFALPWNDGQDRFWTIRQAPEGKLKLPEVRETVQEHQISWLASYLNTAQWMQATLHLKSHTMFRVFLNGQPILTHTDRQAGPDSSPALHSQELTLKQGGHFLLIKLLHPAGEPQTEETMQAWIQADGQNGVHPAGSTGSSETGNALINWSLSPRRTLMQSDLSNAARPAGVSISPDGTMAALHIRQDLPPDGTPETWIDLVRTSDGSLVQRFSGSMSVTGMQWVAPGQFSYTDRKSGGTDLWLADLNSGKKLRVLHNIEDFSGYRWAPDGSYVIYSKAEEYDPRTDGVLRYHGLQDRRPQYHRRTYLYQHYFPQGPTRRLTAGRLSTSLSSIHPDADQILFMRSHESYDRPPYGASEYVILDLNTLQTDSLFTIPFGGAALYSPDGRRIALMAGPNAFGDLCRNLPDNQIANDYDTQIYLYELQYGKVECITKNLDPAVESMSWDPSGGQLYLVTTDQSFRRIFLYDLSDKQFTRIESGPDVVGSLQVSAHQSVGVFTGSGAFDPPKFWTVDFNEKHPRPRILEDPGAQAYRHIHAGEIKPWYFANEQGERIDGHVYYPPDFDARRKYPVIVYYYGGTTPTPRNFGGRYPKELYAAKGYLVYVVQPSGAVGYGQDFSARHVNDWGKVAGEEIIAGVTRFLEEHPYADRERVGAIGASYGGFMTMYLLTQTDLFAAAVSHAGISNLASYWGEGFWGYQYSGVATAHSYPWNRQDIYVDRSPVFLADRIHTPLLLVTGMSDTNVPPGESLQMFTALKLLGREVAFVAVEEQDHHILDYRKFIRWKDAILSWFDKWLKDEPQWWEESFGP